jgi:hypothetical protein
MAVLANESNFIENPISGGPKIECQVHLPALTKATRVLKPVFIEKNAICPGMVVIFD